MCSQARSSQQQEYTCCQYWFRPTQAEDATPAYARRAGSGQPLGLQSCSTHSRSTPAPTLQLGCGMDIFWQGVHGVALAPAVGSTWERHCFTSPISTTAVREWDLQEPIYRACPLLLALCIFVLQLQLFEHLQMLLLESERFPDPQHSFTLL